MTQEQHDYEMGCAGQAQAEYEAQMAYYQYLDSLIQAKEYQLHAVEIALDMLNSKEFANSGLSAKDYFNAERQKLTFKPIDNAEGSF